MPNWIGIWKSEPQFEPLALDSHSFIGWAEPRLVVDAIWLHTPFSIKNSTCLECSKLSIYDPKFHRIDCLVDVWVFLAEFTPAHTQAEQSIAAILLSGSGNMDFGNGNMVSALKISNQDTSMLILLPWKAILGGEGGQCSLLPCAQITLLSVKLMPVYKYGRLPAPGLIPH